MPAGDEAVAELLAWADEQPATSTDDKGVVWPARSFIAAGAHTRIIASLAARGWRGVWIVPNPSGEAIEWARANGVGIISAQVVHTSERMVPLEPGIVTATIHPSELYEVLPQLPEPHFGSIMCGDASLHVFESLRDWVRLDAVEVQLPTDPALLERLRSLVGPWRTLNLAAGESTVIATRV